jgi:hypothetical protein
MATMAMGSHDPTEGRPMSGEAVMSGEVEFVR